MLLNRTIYKVSAILAAVLPLCVQALGQPEVEWRRAPFRSEFISYTLRETAEAGDREAERSFVPLQDFTVRHDQGSVSYATTIDVAQAWLEREVFLHTEGGRNSHQVFVNGRFAGSARDGRLPSEFNISPWLKQGINTLVLTVVNDTEEPEPGQSEGRPDFETIFIYGQPRVRIQDYSARAVARPGGDGRIDIEIIVRNGHNYPEGLDVGYDVYSPDGKLQDYDIRRITLAGQSSDTLRLRSEIYGAGDNLWTAEKPNLYRVTLLVRRGGFVTEYIPVKAGFYTAGMEQGEIIRNGKPLDIRPVRYNASRPEQTVKDIRSFKKRGINTIYVDYPQPIWFYEACDREGIYVVDQANINTPRAADNLAAGGTLSNAPEWLTEYLLRAEGTYMRSHNHPCIIAWSTGGESGNGYNMQRTYLLLKSLDRERPVIYRHSSGQWNSDIELPPAE